MVVTSANVVPDEVKVPVYVHSRTHPTPLVVRDDGPSFPPCGTLETKYLNGTMQKNGQSFFVAI